MITGLVNEKTSLVFVWLSLIITYLAILIDIANYRAIQSAYAQTNAVMFATLASTNNNNGIVVENVATATGAATANSTSTATAATSKCS